MVAVEPDSAVSLSSTAHKRTVHSRNVCVCEGEPCTCMCVWVCGATAVFVFPLAGESVYLFVFLVLSPFQCGDGVGMHTEVGGHQISSCVCCGFLFHLVSFCCLAFYLFYLLSFASYSALTPLHICLYGPPHLSRVFLLSPSFSLSPVIPSPQAFPVLALQSRQPQRKPIPKP